MEKCLVTVPAAFMHVRDNLEELGKVADDTDLLFLKGLLDSPVVTSLVKVSGQQFSILRHLPSISIVTIKREIEKFRTNFLCFLRIIKIEIASQVLRLIHVVLTIRLFGRRFSQRN